MRTRMYWYGILSLAAFIAAAAVLWWRSAPAAGRMSAPGPALVHLAPRSRAVFGVDEPVTITLPWPAAPRQLAAALAVAPAVPWHLTRIGPSQYRLQPNTTWPGDRRIHVRIRAAALYPGRMVLRSAHTTLRTDDDRTVVVNLTLQVMQAYQGGRLVATMPVSTGVTPEYPTPTGHFYIWRRVRLGDMRYGQPGQPDAYRVPHVPFAQYIYRGIAIHGAYWARQFGVPHSHGCIQLPTRDGNRHRQGVPEDAGWLWHFTHLGTPVIVRGVTPGPTRLVMYPGQPAPRALQAGQHLVRGRQR